MRGHCILSPLRLFVLEEQKHQIRHWHKCHKIWNCAVVQSAITECTSVPPLLCSLGQGEHSIRCPSDATSSDAAPLGQPLSHVRSQRWQSNCQLGRVSYALPNTQKTQVQKEHVGDMHQMSCIIFCAVVFSSVTVIWPPAPFEWLAPISVV